MSSFACCQAANTKIQARKRAFLKQHEWYTLLNCQSIEEVTSFLKKRYGYESALIGQKEEMHRTQLETILNRYKVTEIERLLHYFSGAYKTFFKVFLMQYEINDLQLILRAIVREEDKANLKDNFMHSKQHTKLSYDKLLKSQNVEQFVYALRETPYYEAIKNLTKEDALERAFHMEMRLNMLYYKMLIETAKKLRKKDAKMASKIIGMQIDYYNIQWIYRALKYYSLSKEEILIYSLSGGDVLSYKRLKDLIYVQSVEIFKEKVERYMKKPIFKEDDDVFLERTIQGILLDMIRKIDGKNSIATSLQYFYVLSIQVIDIIGVTEGIRYQLPKEQIKKYLVYDL